MKILPRILITNDDGISAAGIHFLWTALKDIADITIVAPAKEQSAVGLGITVREPLRIEKNTHFGSTPAWSVTGTPADCVKMALSKLLEKPPQMVVSGINRGSNAGRNVLYSGTVAGAIESTMRGIPSIAFSCYDFISPDYGVAAEGISYVVRHVLEHTLPSGTLLNVNFPPKIAGNIKGFKMARQGKEYWIEDPEERHHPAESHSYYWLGAKLAEFEEHEESDVTWLRKGYVTAVPVHIGELTDYNHLASRKAHFEREI